MLCDLLGDAEAPIVLTGAIRAGSQPGADGPANLVDAVAVAAAPEAAGLGAVVVFGGRVHAARAGRASATRPGRTPSARSRPARWMGRRGPRRDTDAPGAPPGARSGAARLSRAGIVPAALGDDGSLVRAALGAGADGLVAVALGAGHAPPPWLSAVREAAAEVPVALCVRPERRRDPVAGPTASRGPSGTCAPAGPRRPGCSPRRRRAHHAAGLPRGGAGGGRDPGRAGPRRPSMTGADREALILAHLPSRPLPGPALREPRGVARRPGAGRDGRPHQGGRPLRPDPRACAGVVRRAPDHPGRDPPAFPGPGVVPCEPPRVAPGRPTPRVSEAPSSA